MEDNESKLNELIRYFTFTPRQFRRTCQSALNKYGLNNCEISVLSCLARSPIISSLKDIGEYIHTPKSMISRAVDHLRGEGYISTYSDADDRRILRLRLESKSDDIVKIIRACQSDFFARVTEGIPHDELKAFRGTVEKIFINTKKYYEDR